MIPRLEMQGIVKRYPGVLALDSASFSLDAGEVHCLVGENGAGKSTLMRLLSGATQPDHGTILIDGTPVQIPNPAQAKRLGIGIIHQDFQQVPGLSVAENLTLGREPAAGPLAFVDRAAQMNTARMALAPLGEEIDTGATLETLSIAHRQLVEIAKVLSENPRILAFDEPTASLTMHESEALFAVIRRLKRDGAAIIYITHRLDEVFEIGDLVTVLRDGHNVATAAVREVDRSRLIQWMVGREVENEFPSLGSHSGQELLRVENVSARGLAPISFTLAKGEILGVAGLVGSGRSTLARTIFGAERRTGGAIFLEGQECKIRSPKDAIVAGIALLPEDRNINGLVLQMNISDNITLANLETLTLGPLLDTNREEAVAWRLAGELRIRPEDTSVGVAALSGGNRQKVILARWLSTNARVLMFDEPTAGIDVAVKYEIYSLIARLSAQGIGILMISSDLSEIMGICHRVAVLCEGVLTGIVDRATASQEQIMSLATSLPQRRAAEA